MQRFHETFRDVAASPAQTLTGEAVVGWALHPVVLLYLRVEMMVMLLGRRNLGLCGLGERYSGKLWLWRTV